MLVLDVGIIFPIIEYIKGPDNNEADTLRRFPLFNSDVTESDIKRESYLKATVLINWTEICSH